MFPCSALLLMNASPDSAAAECMLQVVRSFADRVLTHARDALGPVHTPLFLDGLNVDTLEPATWMRRGDPLVLGHAD